MDNTTFERICEEVHNAWWDEKKQQGITDHPDMIPYTELSEEVKEYDRVTVRAVLQAIEKIDGDWISVDDRLPEEEGWYLVCINSWITNAWWMLTGWTGFVSCNASSKMVHHWMPLPEPPKEGK